MSLHARPLSSSTGPTSVPQSTATQQPSRIVTLWRQYGLVFLGTYLGIYVVTLGSVYELVSSNYLSAGNAAELLRYVYLDRVVDVDKIDPRMGNFAVAWILTKFTEPVRFVVAATVTPRVARLVGRAPPLQPKNSGSAT